MILFPNTNLEEYQRTHSAGEWQAWLAVLTEHGTQTPDGWQVDWRDYNAVSAARKTGVFDLVAHPPPSPPAEPAASPRPVAVQGGVQSPITPARPCSGCGNAKYSPEDFNYPGGADNLIQQIG